MRHIRLGGTSPRRRWLLRLRSKGIPGNRPRAGHERYSLGRPLDRCHDRVSRDREVSLGAASVAIKVVVPTVHLLTVTHAKIEVTVSIIERRAAPPGSGTCLDGIPAEPNFPLLLHF